MGFAKLVVQNTTKSTKSNKDKRKTFAKSGGKRLAKVAKESDSSIFKKAIEFIPHNYQQECINWILSHLINGLFLDPGLGKTAIVLKAFKLLKEAGMIDKLFVIAPLRVVHMVWPEEIKKWKDFNNFSIGILHGKTKNKVIGEDHDIYIINPEGLKWFSNCCRKRIWKYGDHKWWLVVDESSMFKNARSQRFKILKGMISSFYRRTILTGTPTPRHMENLWPQVYLLDGGKRLGQYITSYRNEFFYPSGYMGYEHKLQDDGQERIYRRVSDIIIHKSDEELNLPERRNNYINIELPPKARKAYDDMCDELVMEDPNSGEMILAVNAAVASGKLRQISNGGIYLNEAKDILHLHDEKTNAVEELHDSINQRPLMVMYEFNHDLERLQAKFPNAPALSGGLKQTDANKIIRDWNNDKLEMLFIHPAAAGHGLNLQESECRDVCWYSIPFDLERYIQTNARVHRQGVKHSVTVHHIVGKDTIDWKIVGVLKKKGNMQDALLGALMV